MPTPHGAPPATPAGILAAMLASDPARPRLTCYDDTPGPTAGERVELSGRVLANWVAKAANCLTDRYAAGPGTRVRLALPALHWRSAYWALATWSAGADVVLPEDPAGAGVPAVAAGSAAGAGADDGAAAAAALTVSDTDPGADVVVTLAALSRSHPRPVHPASMDEAGELAAYGDRFTATEPGGAGWVTAARASQHPPGGTRLALAGDPSLHESLILMLATWAADGSVVLFRGVVDRDRIARLATEEAATELVIAARPLPDAQG